MAPPHSGQELGVTIKPAEQSQVEDIAHLHLLCIASGNELDGSKSSILFLETYYRELLTGPDTAVLVALLGNRLVGYCTLVANQGRVLQRLIARRPIFFLKAIGSFQLTRYMAGKVYSECLGGKWQTRLARFKGGYELRSVAVDANYRSASVGTRLVQRALAHARDQQWNPVVAWVADENSASCHVFEKAGFQRVGYKLEAERVVHLYSCMISTNANYDEVAGRN